MGRAIKQEVPIEEIFFDEDLYPRTQYNWQTGYDYSQSMKTGSKFPEIILAVFNNRKYLVDGKHRIEACKLLKLKTIKAIIHTGWNKEKIFEEAIKSNISHGRVLSPYEKRRIALKLKELRYSQKDISGLIQVPLDKLETFVGSRLINTLSGEPASKGAEVSREIAELIIKSGAKHLSGRTLSPEELLNIENVQKSWYMNSQVNLLKQVIDIIENDLLDTSDQRVMELYNYLVNLIKKGNK